MEPSIGIIGLGLIGGSIARAVRAFHPHTRIVAWNRGREALEQALRDGNIDVAAADVDASFSECTAIVTCLPAEYTLDVLKRLKPVTTPDTLILDASSTKANIMEMAHEAGIDDRFVGGHPMAGSEQTGYRASRINLYENAWFVLTPFAHTPEALLARAKKLASAVGALPIVLDAAEHDRVVAMISHLPHVVAAMLVNLVRETDSREETMHLLAAGGFRDITRIASSSASLWNGICMNNRDRMLEAVALAEESLRGFRMALEACNEEAMTEYFEQARTYRDSFSVKKTGSIFRLYEITADVDDRPGILARVATVLADRGLNIKNMGINNSREEEEGALVIRFENEEEREAGMEALAQAGYRVTRRFG